MDENCVKYQEEFKKSGESRKPKKKVVEKKKKTFENDWGIKIVDEFEQSDEVAEVKDVKTSNMSLDDLKNQFKMLSSKK